MQQWQKNLYILFLAELLSIAGLQVIVPFLSLYVGTLAVRFGTTEFWAGLVFSAQAMTIFVASPIWGALADRFGRKVMVQRAMIGGAFILGMMGLVQTVEQLVLLRAVQGAVTGVVPAAYALVAASVPRERTGYAMGLMQMSVWIGMSIGPLLGGVIADTFGFRAAFFITAFCLLMAGVGVSLFVREEFVPPPTTPLSGRLMLGSWLKVTRAPLMKEYLSMHFLAQMGQSTLLPFLPLFVAALLASQERVSTLTGLAVGVMSGAGALSAVYLGRLSDRLGAERLLIACSVLVALSYGAMSLVGSSWQLVVLHALAGSALGGIVPVISALMSHAAPEGQTGSVYGLDSSVMAGGRMLAPVLGAGVIALTTIRGMFWLAAATFLLVALIAAGYRRSAAPLEAEVQRKGGPG